MKRFLIFMVLILSVVSSIETSAQCAMCRTTLENNISQGNPGIAAGINFGAMFVSYAITVVLMVASSTVLWLFFDASTNTYIVTFIAITILFSPLSYRCSRLLWLYWFGGHTRMPKP
jgi:hypothetical protein